MLKKVIIESLKVFGVGAVIGLIIMFFKESNNLTIPFITGVITLSIYSRENLFF
ncbi:hypothetical protein [Flavobacterium sp.]|uniref:hypothetical protein n=1 Tax=Flavobacterium sp. TaxID=239 RepID=UPI0026137559|nr:hypothetical protein [Flavobacterium sp.]